MTAALLEDALLDLTTRKYVPAEMVMQSEMLFDKLGNPV
jgi:hypothetical protein